ncbi:MAG: hypothetical protein KGI27_00800 [Thaumarchaeota archaeon]|nr:hypothetical protein [Nitrososphaerota archaeon]
MLHFSKDASEPDLSGHLFRIKTLSTKIEQKIAQKDKGGDEFIETLSVEELKDLRQVILASEYLLTKYQDKRDLKAFLEDFVGIIMHAANSVNGMKDELEDLVISAEVALQQIQTLHHEVIRNVSLGRTIQTKMDDFEARLVGVESAGIRPTPVSPTEAAPSSINLTNSVRRINTSDYLERTAVEN